MHPDWIQQSKFIEEFGFWRGVVTLTSPLLRVASSISRLSNRQVGHFSPPRLGDGMADINSACRTGDR
jgi:hypothetical protein